MRYEIENNKIMLYDADTFTPEGALASGQVFRFGQTEKGTWWVISGGNRAEIEEITPKNYIISTTNPNFFVKYFDFDTNYDIILSRLNEHEILRSALKYSRGVRLLRQPLDEVIINFIVSANNNIPRIRNSVNKIAEKFGKKMPWGYSFPTLKDLSNATIEDFQEFGCGYRSGYLVDTIKILNETDFLERVQKMDTKQARRELLTLKGVGPKVADCILLFGMNRFDVFPVDTWIYKVYREEFSGKATNREQIADFFVNLFGMDSGYCQQYLFYYKRKHITLR
ncbi:MAG: hypothetical protein IJ301_00965 [Clostridia bacterium]|nr:hypothetical protein [Clostridia bacterium]